MTDNTLTLADGTVINTQTGQRVLPGHVVVPTNEEAVQEVTRVRKRLADLPDIPQGQLNITAVVCTFYMFGLEDFEIAHAVGLTETQVQNIKMTAAFDDLVETLRGNMLEGQQDDIRSLLVSHANTAARTMVNELSSSNGQNRIVAAKDIMDRAGFRPADVVEHRHKVEGGLTIEYVKKGGEENMPTLDITAEDVTDE